MCTPFKLDLSDSIAQVLGAVSWSTLKSLVLSGINLNEWIDIWPSVPAPQLQCLQIQGTSSGFQKLAHSSIMLVLPSFTLNITTLSQPGLTHVPKIFSHCILEKLAVKCDQIDLNLSDPLVKVLGSVQWDFLEHMWLSGGNIDQWIQLLAKVEMARLKTLQIRGTKSVQQTLSHVSVLFVERLIGTSPLTELYFDNLLLQDHRDWVLLVEKMDRSILKIFDLDNGSYEQFMSTPDALDLMHSKYAEKGEHSEEEHSEEEHSEEDDQEDDQEEEDSEEDDQEDGQTEGEQ
ncbi:hypothetical protein BGZ82_009873 [Podila clonocystis]|nr:hypothetical protein BGZ82_009873 [Podila clonocystis]